MIVLEILSHLYRADLACWRSVLFAAALGLVAAGTLAVIANPSPGRGATDEHWYAACLAEVPPGRTAAQADAQAAHEAVLACALQLSGLASLRAP